MSRDSGYRPPPTMVKCDNPRCNALYEVSNQLGGHTFTCNRCGSKVTVRDVSTGAKTSGKIKGWSLFRKSRKTPSSTPLLDAIVSADSRKSKSNTRLVFGGLALIVAIIGIWWWFATPDHRTAKTDIFDLFSPAPIPTLQDEIAAGIVSARFSGIGGSSGDSVNVQLAKGHNSGSIPSAMVIPTGSVLVSDDRRAQSMMVASIRGVDLGGNKYRPESQIILPESGTVSYVLAAFCIQFEKENPSPATEFTLKRPDPKLACIARNGSSLTVPAMQAAVWMQTDNITFAQMNQKFPITTLEWAAGRSVFLECRNEATGLK